MWHLWKVKRRLGYSRVGLSSHLKGRKKYPKNIELMSTKLFFNELGDLCWNLIFLACLQMQQDGAHVLQARCLHYTPLK